MPVEYTFDLYPSNDPAGKVSTSLTGARLARLTAGDQLSDAEYWPSLYGPGKGFIEIHGDHPDADLLHRRAWIAVIRTDTVPERPIGGFWLEEGDFTALSARREQRGRVLRFSGEGGKRILERYVLGHSHYAPGQDHRGDYDIPHKWTWSDEPPGGPMVRSIEEGQNDPQLTFAALTYDFGRTRDSNNLLWLEEGDYQVDIGTRVSKVFEDQVKRGVIVEVDYELGVHAYRDIDDYRTDRTSATFAANKVRFEKGVNIGNDLPKRIAAKRERTAVLMRGRTGDYQTVDTDTDGNPLGGEPFYDYIESKTTANPATLERMGQVYLTRLRTTGDQCKVRHLIGPGGAAGADGYDPGPSGDYWLGDLVTVHSGTAEHDYNEQAIEVAAIRYFLEDGNWLAEVDLGAKYIDSRSDPQSQNVINSIVQQVSNPIQFCEPRVELPAAGLDWGSGSQSSSVRVSTNAGGDVVAALPTGWEVGHLAITNACLNGVGTVPTVPAGWTAIGLGGSAGSGAQNIGQRGAWKILEASDAGGVQWLNAHTAIVTVLKGFDEADPIGGIAGGAGSGSTVTVSSPTLEIGDGSSWVLAFAAHDGDNSLGGNAMSGSPAASVLGDAGHHGGWYSADAASWAAHTIGAGASDDWVQTAYEIRAAASDSVFPGDGLAELVGTSTKAKRCDDTEHHHEVGSGSPTVTDDVDAGYRNHTLWINDDGEAWFLIDNSAGAADWLQLTAPAAGAAPDDATYLVTTAHAGLSAEVPVGATPGGELGGTWASPTVDASHSGSTHAATQAAAEATAATALAGHTGDTSDAHDASAVSYDPTASGMVATDVQDAIDELDAAIGGGGHAEDHDHDGAPTQKLIQANTHESPDTDTGTGALHHTLGAGANQAAAGNHSHAGGGIASGTSFPGSPSNNDLFYRTDRDILYFYDGTRWLSVNEYDLGIGWAEVAAAISGTQTLARWPVRQDYGIYLVRWAAANFATSAGTAGNHMSVVLARVDSANTATTIASFLTNTGSASNWTNRDQAINAVLDSSARSLRVVATEVGTVTGWILAESIIYRLIG